MPLLGWVLFGATGFTGFNLYSMIVAIVGAVVALGLYHALQWPFSLINW
jgi:uncharacterized membrane protein YeaQ/YmgE (transglycosylase-associated protein family)